MVTATPMIRTGAEGKMGREYEKEGGGRGPKEVPKRPEEAAKRLQEAPERPRDDVTVRAPDVHPAKREESTSGSDVLPEAGPQRSGV